MAKARNGKIEWMRFVFSILIVLFHINLEIWGGKQTFGDYFSLSGRGRIGVEFFFVVSGYLMAATAFRNQKKAGSLGKETVQFMTKKIYGIWPWHLVAFTLLFIAVCVRTAWHQGNRGPFLPYVAQPVFGSKSGDPFV